MCVCVCVCARARVCVWKTSWSHFSCWFAHWLVFTGMLCLCVCAWERERERERERGCVKTSYFSGGSWCLSHWLTSLHRNGLCSLVLVWEREREREREGGGGREGAHVLGFGVWENGFGESKRERERERERNVGCASALAAPCSDGFQRQQTAMCVCIQNGRCSQEQPSNWWSVLFCVELEKNWRKLSTDFSVVKQPSLFLLALFFFALSS